MIEVGVIGARRVVDHARETALLMDELAKLMEVKMRRNDSSVSALIRSFIARYRSVAQGGNPGGIQVGALPAKGSEILVFAHIPGAGAVRSLPTLVLPSSSRITEIMRVVGRLPRFPEQRTETVAVGYCHVDTKPIRRAFP